MVDIGIVQKKIEDAIFDFIDTDLKSISALNISSRAAVYNEVINLVEDKILPLLHPSDVDELQEEVDTMENELNDAQNAFDNLRETTVDELLDIKRDVKDVLERLDKAIDEVNDSEIW